MSNQASEDYLWEELADKLEWYSRYRERGQDDDMDRAFDGILALIRTEKLKLLEEVRERVVGEDVSIVGTTDADLENQDTLLYVQAKIAQNIIRAEQRTALNKLEAEL